MPTPVKKKPATAAKPPARRAQRVTNRPSAIQPVSDEGRYARILIHGEPGVGKSRLAATAPKSLMLVNDPDETTPAALMGSDADRWHINDYGDLEDAYQYLLHEGTDSYDWVWLDNGTLIQDQGMDGIMMELVSRPGKEDRNRFIPDLPQYLESQNRFGTYVRMFKQLDVNFGLITHTMRTDDEDGKVVYLPMLQGGQGQFSQKICGYFGCVFYMEAIALKEGGTERRLLTEKRSKYYAKDRYSAFGGRIVNPEFPGMMKKIAAARKTAA